jgi:hypothetical protein
MKRLVIVLTLASALVFATGVIASAENGPVLPPVICRY